MNEHLNIAQLTDYLHHALDPESDAAAYAHIAECTTCGAAYGREAAFSEALRAQARATERELPGSVLTAVRSRIAAETSRSRVWEAVRSWLRPAFVIPAVAIAAVVLFIGVPRFVANQQPASIQAAYYLQGHSEMNGTMPFADATSAVPASLTGNDTTTDQSVAVMPTAMTADDAP